MFRGDFTTISFYSRMILNQIKAERMFSLQQVRTLTRGQGGFSIHEGKSFPGLYLMVTSNLKDGIEEQKNTTMYLFQ